MRDQSGLRISEIPAADQQGMTFARLCEELTPNTVLAGKVRKTGRRLRISVQLMNMSDGSVIWSEIYERRFGNVVAIQEEIAHAIAHDVPIR
jgi:adenylate cyclase